MSGELHNLEFRIDDYEGWYPVRTSQAALVFHAALIWLGFYYIFIKPVELFRPDLLRALNVNVKDDQNLPDDDVPSPRFQFIFKSWGQYSNAQ